MNSELLLPIVTLIIGWLLKSLGDNFKEKAEHKKSLSKAIADLLEIRHEINGRKLVATEVKKRFKLGKEFDYLFPQIFNQILPNSDDLHKRYNQTVDLIASIDPVLGFELRFKDTIKSSPKQIEKFVRDQGGLSNFPVEFENMFFSAGLPVIEKTIGDLAWQHSFSTWWKVKKLFAQPLSLPKECDDIFKLLESKMTEIAAASVQPNTNPIPAI